MIRRFMAYRKEKNRDREISALGKRLDDITVLRAKIEGELRELKRIFNGSGSINGFDVDALVNRAGMIAAIDAEISILLKRLDSRMMFGSISSATQKGKQ